MGLSGAELEACKAAANGPRAYESSAADRLEANGVRGSAYPLYEAPRFGSFAGLVEHLAGFGETPAAFEKPDGERVTYAQLADAVVRERAALEAEGAGRFVEVADEDPARFAMRYLAVVSSGRCAVLCALSGKQRAALIREPKCVPEGVCTIAASSGTSGTPKAAMLTEHGLLADLASGLELYEFARGARYAKLLPYTHAFGLVCDLLAPLVTGGVIARPSSPLAFATELPRLAPTALNLPPRAASMLADLLDKGAYRLPGLRKMLCGGAGLPASVTQRLRMHGIEAFGCYGLTECSPCVSVNRDGWHKDGSCGVPLRCNEVRVGADGELLVRGTNVMAGYLGDAALTAQRIRDGWLHTGDLGHIDEDGFIFVDGRLDDVIVLAGGTKVAPEVLERALLSHPAIAQALVYGSGEPGQATLACKLVLAEGASKADEADAAEFARSLATPDGARIERVELSRDPLPTNAAGKLLRRPA